MKEYFKSQLKNIPMMIILIVLFYGIKVIADSYAITSADISFDNSGTNITATNMQNAISETFLHATDYNEIKTTIGNSTLTTTNKTLTGGINELKTSVDSLNNNLTPIYSEAPCNTTYSSGKFLVYSIGKIVVIYGNFYIGTAVPSGGVLSSTLSVDVNFSPCSIVCGSSARRVLIENKTIKADSEGIPTGWCNFATVVVAK